MSKLVVVLADTDEKYLMPLELKFIEEFQEKAEIIIITDPEYLDTYFGSPKKVDILVINEDLHNLNFEKHDMGRILLLSESDTIEESQDTKIKKIYKYTSVKEIFNEVLESSLEELTETTEQSEAQEPLVEETIETKAIMIYSPNGGIGKTTVSLGLSGALASRNKKVLYINTETLQSFNYILKNKDFLANGFEVHLIQHDENILEYFEDSIATEMFDYLLPLKQATSSYNIQMDDYKYLIEAVKAMEKYHYIVVDTSTEFTSNKIMMMNFCDRVVTVTGQDVMSAGKLEFLLNNIDCSDNNKFIFICNKFIEPAEDTSKTDNLVSKCSNGNFIPYFEFNDENYTIEFLSENEHFQKLASMFI